ncbi:hypothetical protein BC829DRAFT_128841 [Chytridium lagenaria]|nr:hypothetical protein BC829DRAFT_128841 [Chytridium lagenaria]
MTKVVEGIGGTGSVLVHNANGGSATTEWVFIHSEGRTSTARPAFDAVANILDGYLSDSKLRSLTNEENLGKVTVFETEVDVRKTSLSHLGKSLPNLQRLKLRNGYVPSIRDLGCGYDFLSVLWITRCQLTELDGIGSIGTLKELYLSYNEVEDLSSLGMLDCLEILDLEGNNISDINQIDHLSLCTSLQSLTLEGNPITTVHEENTLESTLSKTFLRTAIWNAVPHLQVLDDEPLHRDECRGTIPDEFMSKLELVARSRPPSAIAKQIDDKANDASSDLTFGTDETIAGNPILFLRSRRSRNIDSQPPSRPTTAIPTPHPKTHGPPSP